MGEETVVTTTDTTGSTTEQVAEPVVTTQEQNPEGVVTQEAQTTAEPPAGESVRVVPEADAYVLPEWVPKEFGARAHSNNLTQEQLDKGFEDYNTLQSHREEADKKAIEAQGKEYVKTHWGENAKDNLQTVNNGLRHVDKSGKLAEWLHSTGNINSPLLLDAMMVVGNMMKEGGFVESSVNTPKKQGEMAHRLYPNDVPK